jgi:uncharacterized protein YdeI (YjbR/CyaY-like superfamily)
MERGVDRGARRPGTVSCGTLDEWRDWLEANHLRSRSIWLVFRKGRGGGRRLTYAEALDEALCYGWIDSLIRRIDEETYARMFSKRRETSKWSPINKARVRKLMAGNRMAPAGLAAVQTAKANGSWDRPDRTPPQKRAPRALREALRRNARAFACFKALPPSHKQRYIMWIATAKRRETIRKRVAEAVRLLEKKRPLGLK